MVKKISRREVCKVHCGYGYAGAQWEKARELFELMQQQGCMPDVVTYTALISAYERGGKWQLALQVLLFSQWHSHSMQLLAMGVGYQSMQWHRRNFKRSHTGFALT